VNTGRPVFVRLGRAESDPVVFWRYVVAALKTVHRDLGIFLEDILTSLTLAIGARPGARLQLASQFACGLVHDLEMSELCFTIEEARAVITKVGPTRSARDIRTIYARTEGRPAGVYLASRNGTRLPPTAPQHEIRSYLVTEMLDDFDVDEREFMRTTAILEELDPDLCHRRDAREGSDAAHRGAGHRGSRHQRPRICCRRDHRGPEG
jgi:ATP/maltotriose-dependent transcriptional regulator MalT